MERCDLQYLQMLNLICKGGLRQCSPRLLVLTVIFIGALFSGLVQATEREHAEAWRSWARAVNDAWESWANGYMPGTDREYASFASVIDVFRNQPEGAVGQDGDLVVEEMDLVQLKAMLDAYATMNFWATLMPEAHRAGFSIHHAYANARSIATELARRDALSKEDAERMLQLALGVNDFETARWVVNTHDLDTRVPTPRPGTRFPEEAVYRVWRFHADGTVSRSGFEFPKGIHWVIVSSENCGFCHVFFSDLKNKPELRDLVAARLTWLMPPEPHLVTEQMQKLRQLHPDIEPMRMHDVAEWPMFPQFVTSPGIYLMEGERVLASWTGWPLDRSYLPQLIEAFQQHARDGTVQRTPPDVTLRQ